MNYLSAYSLGCHIYDSKKKVHFFSMNSTRELTTAHTHTHNIMISFNCQSNLTLLHTRRADTLKKINTTMTRKSIARSYYIPTTPRAHNVLTSSSSSLSFQRRAHSSECHEFNSSYARRVVCG